MDDQTFEICTVCGAVGRSALCSPGCRGEAGRRLARNVRRLRRLQNERDADRRQRLAVDNGWLLSAIWRYDQTA